MGLFAIPAWILGKAEREAIRRGQAPEAGQGMAEAGYILGIIGVVVLVIMAIAVVAWILGFFYLVTHG